MISFINACWTHKHGRAKFGPWHSCHMAYPPIAWSCAAINFPCKPIVLAPSHYNSLAQRHDDEIRTHSEFLERGEGPSTVCFMLGPSADRLWPAWRATCLQSRFGSIIFKISKLHRPPSSKFYKICTAYVYLVAIPGDPAPGCSWCLKIAGVKMRAFAHKSKIMRDHQLLCVLASWKI